MQQNDFSETVEQLIARDPRFDKEAYFFVRDALDFTVRQLKRQPPRPGSAADAPRHVTGQELLEGVRQFALQEYGPMTATVLAHWRVTRTEDIGTLVFNLIEVGIFGRTEQDSIKDFKDGFDFHDAFVKPYLPAGKQNQPPAPAATSA